jgi:hypothetical protein
MAENKSGGFFDWLKKDKAENVPDTNEQIDSFYKQIQENIAEQVKCLDAMSRIELIKYAAETRVNAMAYLYYQQEQLTMAYDSIRVMTATNKVLVDTVNKLIKKNKCELINVPAIIEKVSKEIAAERDGNNK